MMEHIRQFDWCAPIPPSRYFIDEAALDNCNTEKIIKNKFFDPLISSDDEERRPHVIDWDAVFKTNNTARVHKIFVPGLRPVPPYPKLSVLTGKQHYQCLKVICAAYPHVLEEQIIPQPTTFDLNTFEMLKQVYEKEQKEFIEWAKSLWTNQHCIRVLRPKPTIETIYEAEFKIRAQRLSGYPKHFDMAAQIPLQCTREYQYVAEMKQILVKVDVSELPKIEIPQPITKNTSVLRPCSMPEPCHKHPYQFILPKENSVSVLPIAEIHRELANYAAENRTRFIASENAIRCLVENNRYWTIPVSVCQAYTPDGESCNVVVLDSEFSIHKEPAMMRTYKAMRHLLEHALIPSSEIEKTIKRRKKKKEKENKQRIPTTSKGLNYLEPELSSDDESMAMVIFDPEDDDKDSYLNDGDMGESSEHQNKRHFQDAGGSPAHKNKAMASGDITMEDINDIIGVYSCTCTDTLYELPPRRSFKKWSILNRNTYEELDVIIHCTHKARYNSTEVILDPIPEYQLELGASELPPDRIRSLALALMLREDADLLNVRLDGCNGDMVTFDTLTPEQFLDVHTDSNHQVLNVVHTTLSELQSLLPGQYLLQHEPSHGSNAFLHVSRANGSSVELEFDSSLVIELDEVKTIKTPPTITPVLMPHHKFRKTLPCAFTPFDYQLAKEQKKAPAKLKPPPQALKSQAEGPDQRAKWPKRQGKKKKK